MKRFLLILFSEEMTGTTGYPVCAHELDRLLGDGKGWNAELLDKVNELKTSGYKCMKTEDLKNVVILHVED